MNHSRRLVACGLAIATTITAHGQVPPAVPEHEIATPSYLELVSLSESRDTQYHIAIKGPKGKTWYREQVPGADLRHVVLDRTNLMPVADEHYRIRLWIKDSRQDKLQRWSQSRLEKPIGVVVDGTLLVTDTLYHPLSDFFTVGPFETFEEAVRVFAGIRMGGDKDQIDGETKALARAYEERQAEQKLLAEQAAKDGPPDDALEVVSLRKERDGKHTQPLHGPSGKWWYRDPVAGLDLGHCETYSLGGLDNAAYGYRAVVKDDYVKAFSRWCEERRGKYFGLVSDGQLMFVDRMPGSLVDRLGRLTLVLEAREPMTPDPGTKTAPESGDQTPRLEFSVQHELVRPIVLEPTYLQIVSLRSESDENHTERVKQPDGERWYRAEEPGLDLRHIAFTQAYISGSLGGTYRLCLPVRKDARDDFATWCKEHAGGNAGVILGGKLVRVQPLSGEAPHVIEIATYSEWAEAVRVRDTVRNGGTIE